MKLNPPSWFTPFIGASKSFQPSNDGSFFFAMQGHGNRGFGMYVFRQVGNDIAKEVQYGPVMDGRGIFQLGGDGILYITGSYLKESNTAHVYVVPEYVRYTNAGPAPVPIPVVQNSVDSVARDSIGALSAKVNNLGNSIQLLMKTVASLVERPVITLDLVWSKANDAIFHSANAGYLAEWTWQKALDAAYKTLKDRNLISG